MNTQLLHRVFWFSPGGQLALISQSTQYPGEVPPEFYPRCTEMGLMERGHMTFSLVPHSL